MEDDAGEEQVLDVPDDAPTPEEALLSAEEHARLVYALSQLDASQRQIITLRVVNDLSYAEIAEILDVKEGTVKSRLARARDNLRKKLLQIGNKPELPASNK